MIPMNLDNSSAASGSSSWVSSGWPRVQRAGPLQEVVYARIASCRRVLVFAIIVRKQLWKQNNRRLFSMRTYGARIQTGVRHRDYSTSPTVNRAEHWLHLYCIILY